MVRRVLTTLSVSVEEESEVMGLCGSFFEVDRVKADTEVQQIAVVINWSSFIVDVFIVNCDRRLQELESGVKTVTSNK